ncbi:hypothetical protein, partial [Burkholderia pseudomallei]
SSSSGIVQLKQPRPFSKIEMARRNQAGHSVVIGFRLTRRDRIRRAIAWCDRPARRSFHYRKPAQSRRRRRLARLARLGAILEDSMDAIFILFASRPQQRRCSVGQNGSPVLFAGCVNQREPSTVM